MPIVYLKGKLVLDGWKLLISFLCIPLCVDIHISPELQSDFSFENLHARPHVQAGTGEHTHVYVCILATETPTNNKSEIERCDMYERLQSCLACCHARC